MTPTKDTPKETWEERFDTKFTLPNKEVGGYTAGSGYIPAHLRQRESMKMFIKPDEIKAFIAHELELARREGYEEGKNESHPTINGFCCACDYDIAFMKGDRVFEIDSLKKTCKHCGVIRAVKLHEDTDSHDRYQVGYNRAIDDVLATLKGKEVSK